MRTEQPLPGPRPGSYRMVQPDSYRTVDWAKWVLRVVVGVGGGILIGIVIPFLLSR